MAESNTFVGVTSTFRDTYQKRTSQDKFSKSVQWAAYQKSPFLMACGVEGFGVEAMKDLQAFGSAKPTGRMVRVDSGVYALRGIVQATTGTSFHTGRMGSMTAQLNEGGAEWGYSWHQLNRAEYIPVTDVEDNGNGLIDIMVEKEERMKMDIVRDFSYAVLGSSSAPDYGVMGPSAVYHDIPNLISVTQTRTIGQIAATNTYWQNGVKAITSIGGGGNMDRPITLRRSWKKIHNDQMKFAEGDGKYLFLATQGAWQYYDRLMYADMVESKNAAVFGTVDKYDAAGIEHYAFGTNPVIWDPNTQVPYGATASTEAIYGINTANFYLAIRGEQNFNFSGWEKPRVHDQYKTLNAALTVRYTPMLLSRRVHYVNYNIPACAD